MKNQTNLIDNSLDDCQDYYESKTEVNEKLVILTMLLSLALVCCTCLIMFYKKQSEIWQGKAMYQEQVIKSNQWKGAEDVYTR